MFAIKRRRYSPVFITSSSEAEERLLNYEDRLIVNIKECDEQAVTDVRIDIFVDSKNGANASEQFSSHLTWRVGVSTIVVEKGHLMISKRTGGGIREFLSSELKEIDNNKKKRQEKRVCKSSQNIYLKGSRRYFVFAIFSHLVVMVVEYSDNDAQFIVNIVTLFCATCTILAAVASHRHRWQKEKQNK
uniref:Uncharacterized protein n=1 Tax=Glossina austeni TaxID=7395 RepID=A0A1A9UD79_GLOAU